MEPWHARPGARNRITDVPGLMVWQAQDLGAGAGVTVILPGERAVCAADLWGGVPTCGRTDRRASPGPLSLNRQALPTLRP